MEPRRSTSLEPTVKCFKCNQLGHIAPNCPEKSALQELEEDDSYDPQGEGKETDESGNEEP
jgi:hypothetical protein